ncbi:MAG: RNA polymerase sigma factor [Gammaproteobacteria bacterium]
MDRGGRLDKRTALDGFLAGIERRAYRMAEMATGNPDDALDVVQEAMLQLCRRYADRDEAEWRPLFYRILQNCSRDFHRRRAVRNRFRTWLRPWRDAADGDAADPLQGIADPAGITPEAAVAQDAAMDRLQSAVHRLPARQQQAFMLRIWDGLDVNATARAMGCSGGSVKTHLSRALQTLRQQLDGHW